MDGSSRRVHAVTPHRVASPSISLSTLYTFTAVRGDRRCQHLVDRGLDAGGTELGHPDRADGRDHVHRKEFAVSLERDRFDAVRDVVEPRFENVATVASRSARCR